MKKQVLYAMVSVSLLGAVVAWQRVGAAQSAAAAPTIAYSGFLEDAGTPVDGSRQVGLSLWKTSSTANASDRVCTQPAAATAVASGWFNVALATSCVDALRAFPNLFLQFSVDAVDFPLQPIGAVPYALRALEFNSGSRLRRIVIQGADGSKQDDPTRWWDSERSEECSFRKVNGQQLCLPPLVGGVGQGCSPGGGIAPGFYSEATCQAASLVTNVVALGSPPKYLYSATSSSGLATVGSSQQAYYGCSTTCSAVAQTVYKLGADIDASEFVSGTETHD
jgi:hypothetical protein